ncbi:hypothetical protein [Agrobacterium pusense]|uniref:hypothetical protein n=1 Tax=Agrobacterium pusense TaxID=648995 RepID=UPI0012E9A624|nr:hypothetical protein [Agrobacterium pusense]QWW77483.1 hypothetical protein KP800_22120 [Agrobacterium pusense]
MIWALIPNWLKIAAGGLLCALLLASGSYWLGKREGRSQAATEALAKTVEVLQSRNDTNVEINSSAAAELCAHYGLPDEERLECVRRLAKASGRDSRNGSLSLPE